MTPEEVNGLIDLLISSGRWSELESKRKEVRIIRYYKDADDNTPFRVMLPVDSGLSDYTSALEMGIKTMLQLEEPLASMVKFLYNRQCLRGAKEIVNFRYAW